MAASAVRLDALLCDHAQPGGDGKLYVAGAGTSSFVVMADATQQWVRIGVAGTASLPSAVGQVHEVAVWVEDDEGRTRPLRPPRASDPLLARIVGRVEVTAHLDPSWSLDHVLPFCVTFEALLDGPGGLTVVVGFDGTEARRLPCRVLTVEMPRSEDS